MTVKVSVIVPAYNSAATIEDCLGSIINQNYPGMELIVVDDASSDDTLAKAARYPAKIISQPKNYGAANSRNVGANHAAAEYLIFIDSDIALSSGAVLRVITTLVEDNRILAAGGIYSEEMKGLNFISDFKNLDLAYRAYLCADYVKYLGSFFLAVKKTHFLEAGGFPADLGGAAAEDIEFGYRLTKGKSEMYINKDIRVRHLKRYTLPSMLKTDFNRIINMMRIIKKSRGRHLAGEHAPLPCVFNLFLPGLILLSIPLAAGFNLGWLTALLASAFVVNNSGFVRFLLRKRGAIFALKCLCVLFIEYIAAGTAVLISIFL